MKFKITIGFFQRFVHTQMLIDELENQFGISNVQTRIDPGFFSTVVYITITGWGSTDDKKKILAWWSNTDKSGKNYKIELIYPIFHVGT
jgi:hypothetical protein